jgi:uncharacterized protein (TIGR00255 family)
MSGYGRGEAEGELVRVAFEMRAVNHRFCRVTLHMPSELAFFEAKARQIVRETVQRGKIDLSATVGRVVSGEAIQVNRELAESYCRAFRGMGRDLGVAGDLDLSTLAGLPGVIATPDSATLDPERDVEIAEAALRTAIQALDQMRTREGEHLREDLIARFEKISADVRGIQGKAAEIPRRYRDQLSSRVAALCEEVEGQLDPVRLAQEVAYYADRSDITEELVRLRSHLAKGQELLSDGGGVGRSLEFLIQELHREINTIGSKAKATDIADVVLEMKSELERIREQVQNIE